MYPYKKYDSELNEMIYNYDGSIENKIAITVDKMVNYTLHNTDGRLIDIIYEYYNKSSMDCDDVIQTIIKNWLDAGDYKHIHTLTEYYILAKG